MNTLSLLLTTALVLTLLPASSLLAAAGSWIETGSQSTFLRINASTPLAHLEDDYQRCRLANFSRYHGKILKVAENWLQVRLINPPPSCAFGSVSSGAVAHIYRPELKSFSGFQPDTNLASHYWQNYNRIKAKAKKFWPRSFACAAFASTALKDYGVGVRQVLVTNDLESQLIRQGFRKISNMNQLVVGDVVFASKIDSNIPGTYAHVYVFNGYTANRQSAIAIDNYNRSYQRNLYSGQYTRSVVAYRKP